MKTPESIKSHAADHPEKAAKDLEDAQNYLNMIQARVDHAKGG